MTKYLCVFLCFLLFGVFLVAGVNICPDLQFLLNYDPGPIQDNPDFLFGSMTSAVAMCCAFSIFLGPCLVLDLFKCKSSGNDPDKNIKNENKE